MDTIRAELREDEVATAREAREVPSLTTSPGPAGVSLDVKLEPSPRKGRTK